MTPEEENTFRALKDQGLLVTSKWCNFGFHTWTRWRLGEVKNGYNGATNFYSQELHRMCIHCDMPNGKVVRLPRNS